MIPESEYVQVHGSTCVSYVQVAKYHPGRLEEFEEWMRGQTCAVSPVTHEPMPYASDYERWLSGACVVD